MFSRNWAKWFLPAQNAMPPGEKDPGKMSFPHGIQQLDEFLIKTFLLKCQSIRCSTGRWCRPAAETHQDQTVGPALFNQSNDVFDSGGNP